jgi:hypothetical protein
MLGRGKLPLDLTCLMTMRREVGRSPRPESGMSGYFLIFGVRRHCPDMPNSGPVLIVRVQREVPFG